MSIPQWLRAASSAERAVYLGALGLVALLGFGRCAWNRSVAHGIEVQQLHAQLKTAQQREAVAVAYASSVRAQIYHDTLKITRTTHATDTLYATLPETVVTAADTVRVVQAFPILRAGYDSLKQSCQELQSHALSYVSACDSIQAALRTQRDILTKQLHAERPKWYAKPLHILEYGAVGYIGYKIGRAR